MVTVTAEALEVVTSFALSDATSVYVVPVCALNESVVSSCSIHVNARSVPEVFESTCPVVPPLSPTNEESI
jgi:hypothetical protein